MARWKDLQEEIAQHVDDRYSDLRAQGRSHDDARAEAMSEIDDDLARNCRHCGRRPRGSLTCYPTFSISLRGLRRSPIFAIVIVLTLALRIGANSAIFSIVNAVVLRPLPYDRDGRVVVVRGDLKRPGANEIPASAGEYVDYRNRSHAFDHIAAYDTDGFNLTGDGSPERA